MKKQMTKIAMMLILVIGLTAGANAQNSFPVAIDDFYGVDQLAALDEPAPGVLVNDSDADVSNTLTAALVTGPSHARSFLAHFFIFEFRVRAKTFPTKVREGVNRTGKLKELNT